jgi:hypothetical protein
LDRCPKTRRHRAGPGRHPDGISDPLWEVLAVSIVRIGLAETKHFAEGYESIFGTSKKKAAEKKPVPTVKAKAGKKPAKKKPKK